ncbi:MAG: glutamyl-tRNA reductase [Pseudomonadota bacterium]
MAANSALRLAVVGANHRSSAAALRDRLFIADAEMPFFLAALRQAGLRQAIVLSTCDRVEVQAADIDAEEAAAIVTRLFAERAALPVGEVRRQLYALSGPAALKHMFAVAASLDSQVIGEPNVLGQVKAAHRLAHDAALMGPELDLALQAAFGAAKRVRSETTIGERPVTLSSAAVEIARKVHGDLAGCAGLLIGGHDMGALLIEQLRAAGLKRLAATGPAPARAEEIARQFGCHLAPFDPLAPALVAADIVVSSAGTGRHLVTGAMMAEALKSRRNRPVLLIDLGVPADVAPEVERLDGAFRYDLDDLERVAMSGLATREAEAAQAWRIAEHELATFALARAERAAVPAILALRRHLEALRARALREADGDAARATELLVSRLLHDPLEALRRTAAKGPQERGEIERLVYELFGLEDEADGDHGGRDQENAG